MEHQQVKHKNSIRTGRSGVPVLRHFQCSAERFHNWGQCTRALEKVGTFEKKAGTLWEK